MALVDIAMIPTTEDVVWVYRAEFLAVVRALEECQPHEVVSDCKGVVKTVQALQTGRRSTGRTPKFKGATEI
eukprot:6490968-Amphidinium_carterae.7